MYFARHVEFDESSFPFKVSAATSSSSLMSAIASDQTSPRLRISHVIPSQFNQSSDVSGTPLPQSQNPIQPISVQCAPPTSSDSTTSPPSQAAPPLLHIDPPDSPMTSQTTPINNSILPLDDPPSTNLPPPTIKTIPVPTRTHTMQLRDTTMQKKKFAHLTSMTKSSLPVVPTSFTKAHTMPEWQEAMQQEINALQQNQTWSLVPPPPVGNVVGNWWLYKIKTHADGSIERYKARLVAHGFTQEYGLDYNETFSPVVKPVTIRAVLSVALAGSWPISQLDISNAFLNGDLKETIYMVQPQGFVDPLHPHYVCKLNKSIYGLRQSPRCWTKRLRSFLVTIGFNESRTDPSLYIYRTNMCTCFLLVYVDDIIITGSNPQIVQSLIDQLSQQFSLRNLGRLRYFLGIEVVPHPRGIILSQQKYISELLVSANMHTSKPWTTLMASGIILSKLDGPLLSPVEANQYRKICGSL